VLNKERENDVECWELKKWVLNGVERKKPLGMVLHTSKVLGLNLNEDIQPNNFDIVCWTRRYRLLL